MSDALEGDAATEQTLASSQAWMRDLRLWCIADYWPLQIAARLLCGVSVDTLESDLSPEVARRIGRVHQLARHCLGESRTLKPAGDSPIGPSVTPEALIDWAEKKGLPLKEGIDAIHRARSAQRSKEDAAGSKRGGYVRQSQAIIRERYRALAAYAWQQDSARTIVDIWKDDRIRGAASLGAEPTKQYELNTVRNWIRDLNPQKGVPGRPRKKTTVNSEK